MKKILDGALFEHDDNLQSQNVAGNLLTLGKNALTSNYKTKLVNTHRVPGNCQISAPISRRFLCFF